MNILDCHNKVYYFFRPYVDWIFRLSYRHYHCTGYENLPTDGHVIFAPNHTNALCDAMAILSLDSRAKVFAARADIFRQPRLAAILTFLKIIPIRRIRDGVEAVRHNDETFELAVAALEHDMPFCIFAEGTHRAERGLIEPLSKGIFRIALQACSCASVHEGDANARERKIYIVPVGINYGDYFHLWDSLDITIGNPIPVHDTGEALPVQINSLRDELTPAMRSLVWPAERFPQFQPQWWHHVLLWMTSPLMVGCAIPTVGLWVPMLLVRRMVEDHAFFNSIQYVLQLITYTLTLGLVVPFWIAMQEWLYWFRKIYR